MAKVLRFQEWLKGLSSRGPAPAVFFCGPETLLRDQALLRIKESVFGDAAKAGLGHDRYYGDEGPLSQVTMALASVGLFTRTRLVTLADAEKAGRVAAAERRELIACLQRGTPGSIFVATSGLTVRELERKSEWARALLGACQVVEVAHPTPDEAMAWILQECRRRGVKLLAEAGAYLVSRVGPDLQELSRELEKLELAASPGEAIDLERIRDWMRRGQLGSLWDFCDALLDGRSAEALRLLESVGRTEAVLRIQWIVQRQARDRLGRGGRAHAAAGGPEALLEEAYALERGVKSGRIPSGHDRAAMDFLVVSAGAGTRRPSGRQTRE